ncbi:MAG: T9SS type A sorting domain-containing protein [Melioribacteraceae bacterium]|jgi:hypothetical protein|nr:T9SS type A sorting domain-containing protein [Melioribacteraceae bacterium]
MRTSMHANGYTTVLDDSRTMEELYGMINDYDKNGIDDFKDGLNFNNISSAFDAYIPNAPILGYSAADGYTIQMGDVTHKVFMTYGGSGLYKQRYMMKVETSEGFSNGYYVSPIQFNEKTDEYVVYHGSDWYDGNTPLYTSVSMLTDIANNSRNIAKNCSGCHSNGLEVWQDANNEWLMKGAPVDDDSKYAGMVNVYDIDGDGALDQINTTCERCHGPGSEHAMTTDVTKIINPKNLTPEQQNNLCGMCHSRGKSLPNNTFGFPFNDDTLEGWEVGDIVSDIYTDGGGYWGDKVAEGPTNSTKHHQQFYDLYQSSKPTYAYHQVTCNECHDVHNEEKHHIIKQVVETDSLDADITIATENDNNTLCLSCHATHGAFEDISVEMVADYDNNIDGIGAIVSAHSNHPYDPAGSGNSRCSKCHMPKVGKSAVAYDMHSHTFEVIPPQKTTTFAMPNACATSCHRGIENGPSPIFNTGADASLTDWTEGADIALADKLMESYGPEGSWWNHTVSVERVENVIPQEFTLSQNYPNPFNPSTTIDFAITSQSAVNITVYNAVGQAVEVLVNDVVPVGAYKVTWNASAMASGIYFYRMASGDFVETQKMILLK